jgi:hypothetical protein
MVAIKRERLPNRRQSETFDFEFAGLRYTCTIGRFRDGRIAEIFLAADTSPPASAVMIAFQQSRRVAWGVAR